MFIAVSSFGEGLRRAPLTAPAEAVFKQRIPPKNFLLSTIYKCIVKILF
jgi:hypothetical protein